MDTDEQNNIVEKPAINNASGVEAARPNMEASELDEAKDNYT